MGKMTKTLAAAGLAALSIAAAKAEKPNILLVVADDLGYADLSFTGKRVSTPNIDSIAKNGVFFTNGYVTNSVCAPSRAGLLTGQFGSEFGFERNVLPDSDHGLDVNEKTMGDCLREDGYRTFCLGKWHLGEDKEYHPNKRGFDEFWGFLGGSRTYNAIKPGGYWDTSDKHLEHNGKRVKEIPGYHMTDRLTDKALEYINTHHKESPKQPFFMYLSYTAPHCPFESDKARFDRAGKFHKFKNKRDQNYAGLILGLDDGVGKVVKCLKDNGIYKNTIIVFLSDNGGPKQWADNAPLRGGKGTLWEGGVRVPFMIQWPGKIPKGQTIAKQIIAIDLLPTFMKATGASEKVKYKTNGIDLLPYLTKKETVWPDRYLYWRRGKKGYCAIRYKNFKYITLKASGKKWLFDLDKDVAETKDISDSNPELVEKLKTKFSAWEKQLPEPSWNFPWPIPPSWPRRSPTRASKILRK